MSVTLGVGVAMATLGVGVSLVTLGAVGWCSCGGDLGGINSLRRPVKQNSELRGKQAQQAKAAM